MAIREGRGIRRARGRGQPTVYIVEDDAAARALIGDVAREAGWRVRAFARLATFRAALRGSRPDLVVIDDDLPDGRGGDAARDLRRDGALQRTTVVVWTAAEPPRRAEIAGWATVVPKPFTLTDLDHVLGDGTG